MRCLVVDDNPLFLAIVADHLSRGGMDVVGTATNRAETLRQADLLQPDIVLMDVSLGSDSGFEVTRHLVDTFPHYRGRVVLMSTRSLDDFADLVETSPAAGYLSKNVLSPDAISDLLDEART